MFKSNSTKYNVNTCFVSICTTRNDWVNVQGETHNRPMTNLKRTSDRRRIINNMRSVKNVFDLFCKNPIEWRLSLILQHI